MKTITLKWHGTVYYETKCVVSDDEYEKLHNYDYEEIMDRIEKDHQPDGSHVTHSDDAELDDYELPDGD